MRVPIPFVILLAIAVVSGVWMYGTHGKDPLTDPTAQELAAIKAKVAASFPEIDKATDVISVPAEPPVTEKPVVEEPAKPEIDLGNLAETPTLAYYNERASQGTAELSDLASALEKKGQFQRALLAWERVLDLTKPDPEQAKTAVSAIRRLRPTLPDWNLAPAKPIAIVLEAGTGKKMTKTLEPMLKLAAVEIQKSSAGLLTVSTKINVGKSNAKGPSPVAVWLAGPGKKPVTTGVLSFTVGANEQLHDEVLKTVFQLVRNFLKQSTSYTEPAPLGEKENPMDALNFRITRLCWNEFAASLNLPQKKEPTSKKKR